jgi:hypothetical protein
MQRHVAIANAEDRERTMAGFSTINGTKKICFEMNHLNDCCLARNDDLVRREFGFARFDLRRPDDHELVGEH